MSRRSAVSRADLLESLRRTEAHGGETAAACGFVAVETTGPSIAQHLDLESVRFSGKGTIIAEPDVVRAVPEFPQSMPKLTFLMPVLAETLEMERERRAVDLPPGISDERLALPRGVACLPLAPLVRWARLAPFLKRILGRSVPGSAIDQRRLAREAGRGLPLTVLPRLHRRVWAGQALVLRDDTKEMAPFRQDITLLLRRLRRERGRAGLREVLVRGAPRAAMLAGLPADAPVLALSCMGQYAGAAQQMAAWCRLAQRLAWRGNSFHALTPVPRRCQQAVLSLAWPVAVWDRGVRLPREIAQRGALPPQDRSAATERLLDLLSPATFVEAPLLRAVRRQARGADAAAEWHAWHHPLHWSAPDSFGFLHPEKMEEASAVHATRLDRRRTLPAAETGPVDALIARQHAAHSVVIAAEARLRALLRGPADAGQLACVQSLLDEVLQRLRVLATEPGGSAGRRRGLAAWFLSMVDRLPPAMRGDPSVADAIARGLAVAHVFLETENAAVPSGIASASFVDEIHAAAGRFPQSREYRLDLRGDQWTAQWTLVPADQRPERNAVPLCLLFVTSRSVMATTDSGNFLQQVSSAEEAIALPVLHSPAILAVDSGRERLRLEAKERPWWAWRMQYDRRGLTAFADLNGLRVPLRWLVGDDPAWDSTEWPLQDGGPAVRSGSWFAEQGLPSPFVVSRHLEILWNAVCGQIRAEIGNDLFLRSYSSLKLVSASGEEVHLTTPDALNLKWIEENGLRPLTAALGAVTGMLHEIKISLAQGSGCRLEADDIGPLIRFLVGSAEFTLRWIPPGTFLMGSPDDEPGRDSDEGPQHRVRISQGFWIGDAPVTQEQWRAVIDAAREKCPDLWKSLGKDRQPSASPSHFEGHGDLPVENVSWHESETFCRLLRALLPSGPDFRLPTEAQWEYACRAGTEGAFSDGSACTLPAGKDPALDALGWFSENSGAQTHPVKEKAKPNGWGLHDMHGNVWEWCRDGWDPQAYGRRRRITIDPDLSGDDSTERVVRGGSFFYQALNCRAAFRGKIDPGGIWLGQGLRLSAVQDTPRTLSQESGEEVDSWIAVILNSSELEALFRIPKSDKGKGGFQSLMVTLQERTDRETGEIRLREQDLQRIRNCAFRGSGGYQSRIRAIFARTLGVKLDGASKAE